MKGLRLALPMFLLLLSTPPGATAAEQLDPHEPIHIVGDTLLPLPDAIAGHGIRGGSGTKSDPYVISGWEIDAAGTGVTVSDVSKHIRIEDLRITTHGPAAYGIHVLRSPNIQIDRVATSGEGQALNAFQAGVTVSRLDIQGRTDLSCIRVEQTNLTISSISATPFCQSAFIASIDSSVDAVGLDVHRQNQLLAHEGQATRIHLVDVLVDGSKAPLLPNRPGIGIKISGEVGDLLMENITVVNHQNVCISITDIRVERIRMDSINAKGCLREAGILLVQNHGKISISTCTLETSNTALRIVNTHLILDNCHITKNNIVIDARSNSPELGSLRIINSTIADNDSLLSGEISTIIERSFLDQKSSRVTIINPVAKPLHGQDAESPALSLIILLIIIISITKIWRKP